MKFLKICIPIILFALPFYVWAQVEDPFVIPNNTTSTIEINIGQSSSVNWSINTYLEYVEGYSPDSRLVGFSVSADCEFRVDVSNTLFQDYNGNTIDIENLGYRVEPDGFIVRDRYNDNFKWGSKDGGSVSAELSGIYLGSVSPKNILKPGNNSNAGNHSQNSFFLNVGIGCQEVQSISGLPTLLLQGISGGGYSTVLTITAYPEP